MPLYKQWGVTHYNFDVIVLTSSEKSFSRLYHKIFHVVNVIKSSPTITILYYTHKKKRNKRTILRKASY